MKFRLIPIILCLSWIALIWLWLFHILPLNGMSILAFLIFFVGSGITEAVGEGNDAKQARMVNDLFKRN